MFSNHLVPDPARARLRHRVASHGAHYAVYDQDKTRWLGTQDGAVQAAIHLDQPDEPALNYVRTMLSGLALTERPRRVLDLGYGVGTLRRHIQHTVPRVRVVSVECNHAMVHIGHRWLGGADARHVVMTRAEQLLNQPMTPFDVIFCDLHTPDAAQNPVSDRHFHEAVAAQLNADGVYVLNLLPKDQADAVALLRSLRGAFGYLWLHPVTGTQNLVVHARKAPVRALNADAPFAAAWHDAEIA
ncbi:MAG: methyltransferase [Pseudomonadota bacterium]